MSTKVRTPDKQGAEGTDEGDGHLPLVHESGAKRLQRVGTILKVAYAFEKSNPPNLAVTAVGQVTEGWTGVCLVRRCYVIPPSDGIWEYDLLGFQPVEGQSERPVEVSATDRWEQFAEPNVIGVRVYGEGAGLKEVRFGIRS